MPSGTPIKIESERGFHQGDPLANPGFAVAIAKPSAELRASLAAQDPCSSVYQDADDLQIVVARGALTETERVVRELWPHTGLALNNDKQKVFSHDPSALPGEFQAKRVAYLRC